MNTEELLLSLKKNGITTTSTGGLLNTKQSEKFIQTTVEQSGFLKELRIETGIGTSRELDFMGVGSRLLHSPSENTIPDENKIQNVNAGKRTLTPVEVMLPYNISLKYLEENIEQEDAENTINELFSRQFSNDIMDLSFNGDSAINVNSPEASFLGITDSFITKLESDSTSLKFNRDENTDWKNTVFPALYKNLPAKYKGDPSKLSLLVSYDVEDEYRQQLADRASALGDTYMVEGIRAMYKGIKVEPIPYIPYGTVLLTNKKNLAVGFGRDITVYKMLIPRARRIEYTITSKICFNYVLPDLISYCI